MSSSDLYMEDADPKSSEGTRSFAGDAKRNIVRERNRVKQRNLRARRSTHAAQMEQNLAVLQNECAALKIRLQQLQDERENLLAWGYELQAALFQNGLASEVDRIRRKGAKHTTHVQKHTPPPLLPELSSRLYQAGMQLPGPPGLHSNVLVHSPLTSNSFHSSTAHAQISQPDRTPHTVPKTPVESRRVSLPPIQSFDFL
ncbi:uncharacterized protein I303_106331 [Kwoniella dejecticola CBS 10117]|uniref:BZIP domain-containing protein n=1 Tax=Kwoniella dejecticola CBS 10117 TaxID=1296121 RepID=A0A1A5ZV13_9TREE|nr:uncharacterized protein I303_08412 [Kwoniella dejecticola CBS 10117]OBR81641.1 hypothetical protein I303_08412 [Kwoniella dejecticola CBS 10117]